LNAAVAHWLDGLWRNRWQGLWIIRVGRAS
jgi:hypothetical protein